MNNKTLYYDPMPTTTNTTTHSNQPATRSNRPKRTILGSVTNTYNHRPSHLDDQSSKKELKISKPFINHPHLVPAEVSTTTRIHQNGDKTSTKSSSITKQPTEIRYRNAFDDLPKSAQTILSQRNQNQSKHQLQSNSISKPRLKLIETNINPMPTNLPQPDELLEFGRLPPKGGVVGRNERRNVSASSQGTYQSTSTSNTIGTSTSTIEGSGNKRRKKRNSSSWLATVWGGLTGRGFEDEDQDGEDDFKEGLGEDTIRIQVQRPEVNVFDDEEGEEHENEDEREEEEEGETEQTQDGPKNRLSLDALLGPLFYEAPNRSSSFRSSLFRAHSDESRHHSHPAREGYHYEDEDDDEDEDDTRSYLSHPEPEAEILQADVVELVRLDTPLAASKTNIGPSGVKIFEIAPTPSPPTNASSRRNAIDRGIGSPLKLKGITSAPILCDNEEANDTTDSDSNSDSEDEESAMTNESKTILAQPSIIERPASVKTPTYLPDDPTALPFPTSCTSEYLSSYLDTISHHTTPPVPQFNPSHPPILKHLRPTTPLNPIDHSKQLRTQQSSSSLFTWDLKNLPAPYTPREEAMGLRVGWKDLITPSVGLNGRKKIGPGRNRGRERGRWGVVDGPVGRRVSAGAVMTTRGERLESVWEREDWGGERGGDRERPLSRMSFASVRTSRTTASRWSFMGRSSYESEENGEGFAKKLKRRSMSLLRFGRGDDDVNDLHRIQREEKLENWVAVVVT